MTKRYPRKCTGCHVYDNHELSLQWTKIICFISSYTTMPGQFEKIEINNALTGDEAIAITALENTKAEDLTKALKDEKIKTNGWDKTITELADIFIDCITVSAGGKLTISDEDKKNEPRLEDMVQKWEDLAFFLYTVARCLNIAWSEKLAEKAINAETLTQLKSLKEVVNKKTEQAPSNVETNDTLTEADINFKLYSGVKKSDVISAVNDLQKINPELAKTIIPLLKASDVIGVQKALGMEEWSTPLYKKADGNFGRNTLENLRNGKIVVPIYTTGSGNGNGGWTENGGGNKEKDKNKDKTPENEKTNIENITSIDQLPITQPPAPALTKEYHMEMNMFDKKISIVFYPNGLVKFTGSNSKEVAVKWTKLHDKTLVIDTGLSWNSRYMKFKSQDEFVIACNNAYDSLKEKAKNPEKAKDKSSWTTTEIILGSLLFAPLVPIVLPVAAVTTGVVGAAVTPIILPTAIAAGGTVVAAVGAAPVVGPAYYAAKNWQKKPSSKYTPPKGWTWGSIENR